MEKISSTAKDGQPVDILDSRNRFLARGLLNRKSTIEARIYSNQKEDLDDALLASRLKSVENRTTWCA